MLRALIYMIFLFKNNLLGDACASCCVHKETSCRTSLQMNLVQELAHAQEVYQKPALQDNVFKKLQADSLKKMEKLQNDPAFQEIVTELQSGNPLNTEVNSLSKTEGNLFDTSLYIFVSFSLGEKALLNFASDAKRFGATLVLRGFRDGSYAKTVQALQKIIRKAGQGVIIDPELYSLFTITAVPTFILAKPFTLNPTERTQTPIYDKLQGHVSARYALEIFAKEGDLKDVAQALLKRGAIK